MQSGGRQRRAGERRSWLAQAAQLGPRREAGPPQETPHAPAATKWRLGPVRPPGAGLSAVPSTGGTRRGDRALGASPCACNTATGSGRNPGPRPPPGPVKPAGALRNTAAPWPPPPGRTLRPPRRGGSTWRLPFPPPLFCFFISPVKGNAGRFPLSVGKAGRAHGGPGRRRRWELTGGLRGGGVGRRRWKLRTE